MFKLEFEQNEKIILKKIIIFFYVVVFLINS